MRRFFSPTIIALFLAAVLAGTYAFLFFVMPSLLYKSEQKVFAENQAALQALQGIVANANTLIYGTIHSIDPQQGTVDILSPNPFDPSAPDMPIQITLGTPLYLAHQELKGEGALRDSLSEEAVSSLAALKPGMRIATLLSRDQNGILTTHYILFGNPL